MSDVEYQPLKGDPDLVLSKARHYAEIADAIQRSVTTLRRIGDVDAMVSKAVDSFRDSAKDVAGDIDKAHDRYRETADALIAYSSALRTAQDDATTAIAHIESKQEAANSAKSEAATARHAADSAAETDKATATTAATKSQDAAETADADLRAAHGEWHAALDAKNTAAEAAITAIVNVVDKHNNGLEDSWWDNWGSTLFDILKVVCKWAGVLAIFFAWVPILGQILIVLGAIGAIIDLVQSIVNLINGTGSFGDVIFAAVGAVVTLFGGKIFAMVAKNLRATAIIRTGVTDSGQLARLQGVGAHSSEFMSASSAGEALSKPLSDVFTAPFVRSEAQKTALQAFKDGTKSGPELIKDAARVAFPGFNLSLSKGVGINADLAGFFKLAIDNPSLATTGMRFTAGAATVYQLQSSLTTVTGAVTGFGGNPIGQAIGTGTSFVTGDADTIGGAASSTIGVVKDAWTIAHTGTK
nr:hypothetical protein [Leifsonia poae]